MISYEYLNNLINKNFKGINYKIKKSNITNSLYLNLYLNNVKNTIRLSDHKTSDDFTFKTIYIGKRTKEEKIVRSIQNTLNGMKKIYIDNCFKEI